MSAIGAFRNVNNETVVAYLKLHSIIPAETEENHEKPL